MLLDIIDIIPIIEIISDSDDIMWSDFSNKNIALQSIYDLW